VLWFVWVFFFFFDVAISGGPADGTSHQAVFIPAKPAAAKCWGEGCADSCALEKFVIIIIMPLCFDYQCSPNLHLFLKLCIIPTWLV